MDLGFDIKAQNWSELSDPQRKLVGDEVGNSKKWRNFRENSSYRSERQEGPDHWESKGRSSWGISAQREWSFRDRHSALPETMSDHKAVIPSLLITPFPMFKNIIVIITYMLTLYNIQEKCTRRFLPNRLWNRLCLQGKIFKKIPWSKSKILGWMNIWR